MNEQDRGLELKVGIFVAVGLAMLGALVVQFGRVGEGFKTYYGLTIHFDDASGLLKGSDVLLGGAKIGRVSDPPRLVTSGRGVDVQLRIFDYVQVPAGSTFTDRQLGLLGDRFVSITRRPGKPTEFLHREGRADRRNARAAACDDLTSEGTALMKDLRGTIAEYRRHFSRLNDQALSPANMENLKSSIDHLNQTTGTLAESSKKIDGVIEKAGATMDSAKKAADEVQVAIADARKTIQAATEVFAKPKGGNGLLASC